MRDECRKGISAKQEETSMKTKEQMAEQYALENTPPNTYEGRMGRADLSQAFLAGHSSRDAEVDALKAQLRCATEAVKLGERVAAEVCNDCGDGAECSSCPVSKFWASVHKLSAGDAGKEGGAG